MPTRTTFVPPRDLTGLVVGRLTVLSFAGRDAHDHAAWACRCECGATPTVRAYNLTGPRPTQSCGCLQRDTASRVGYKHGLHKSPTYTSFVAMWDRCTREANVAFKYYGGRGIRVCDRWDDFENFVADMGLRPDGKTLDRIDSDGNYEPGNCRWSSKRDQIVNRSQSCWLTTIDGERISLREMAEYLAMPMQGLRYRLQRLGRVS